MTNPTNRLAEYDGDFYAWALQTAQHLRSGELDQVDLAQVAEEIEDMGKSDRRALESHLKILMLHLLKWRHQPSHRGVSWRLSIANARDEIAAILRDSPSLRPRLDASSRLLTLQDRLDRKSLTQAQVGGRDTGDLTLRHQRRERLVVSRQAPILKRIPACLRLRLLCRLLERLRHLLKNSDYIVFVSHRYHLIDA